VFWHQPQALVGKHLGDLRISLVVAPVEKLRPRLSKAGAEPGWGPPHLHLLPVSCLCFMNPGMSPEDQSRCFSRDRGHSGLAEAEALPEPQAMASCPFALAAL
jgi:hypothetical protein